MTRSIIGQGIMGVATGMLALSLVACGGDGRGSSDDGATDAVEATTNQDAVATTPSDDGNAADAETESTDVMADGTIDVDGIFTDRDMEQSPDLTDAKAIELASGQDSTIAEEGTYVITGTVTDSTIVVEAPDDAKVQLVLSGVSVENADFPAIYVKSADKVFVTTAEGTTNSLSVTGAFVADGETNTDAVIFSHDDLTLNGLGSLSISSPDNGISGKDDIKVTGGTLSISSVADAIEANESVSVSGGTISLDAQKDGINAGNDDDDTTGWAYVSGGEITIKAGGDGIQATTYLRVDGGTISIEASEGIEATHVQVNGGTIAISASDDGINGTSKSTSVGTPSVEISGGDLSVTIGQGDTDALDVNGDLTISGGNVAITAQSPFDYDGQGSLTGGTVTVNGEKVTELANSMMGGGMMSQGGGTMGQRMPGGMQGQRGGMPQDGAPQA